MDAVDGGVQRACPKRKVSEFAVECLGSLMLSLVRGNDVIDTIM